MSNKTVFVIDSEKQPLEQCSPAMARKLLKLQRAAVWNLWPFTIILKKPVADAVYTEKTLSIDPGSKATGLAITDSDDNIVFKAVLNHRGDVIKKRLSKRSDFRRGRRTRNLRHREPRWYNRKRATPMLTPEGWQYVKASSDGRDDTKTTNIFNRVSKAKLMDERYTWERLPDTKTNKRQKKRWQRTRKEYKKRHVNGWVAPSLMSRVYNIETWVNRLRKVCQIDILAFENVKFDTQMFENENIKGVEYQQGELSGYNVREYLLEKHDRKCQYCNVKNVPLEIDHIIPKSKGGSDRISNLTISCKSCNILKGNKLVDELSDDLAKKVNKALTNAKKPLRDLAYVNTIRWKIYETLTATKMKVICGTGGVTKYNRTQAKLPKTHYYDAASVNCIPKDTNVKALEIQAVGYGSRENLGYLFGMKYPGFRKPYNRVVITDLPDDNGKLAKLDHVQITTNNGNTRGVVNCFDDTPAGRPQKLRVKYAFEGDCRKNGNVSSLKKLRHRDGYAYRYL